MTFLLILLDSLATNKSNVFLYSFQIFMPMSLFQNFELQVK